MRNWFRRFRKELKETWALIRNRRAMERDLQRHLDAE